MTVVVLDANVLVPGFVGTMGSVSTRLIDLWREGHYDLVISEHLLGEVKRALDDPYYRSRVPPNRPKELSRCFARMHDSPH